MALLVAFTTSNSATALLVATATNMVLFSQKGTLKLQKAKKGALLVQVVLRSSATTVH